MFVNPQNTSMPPYLLLGSRTDPVTGQHVPSESPPMTDGTAGGSGVPRSWISWGSRLWLESLQAPHFPEKEKKNTVVSLESLAPLLLHSS